MIKDLRLGEDPVGVEHEVTQQLELGGAGLDDSAAAAHLMGIFVEFEVGEVQRGVAVFGGAPGAAEHGPDAGDDLVEAERFGDVVVPADRQALDLVVDAVAGRNEHDRHMATGVSDLAGDGEAVHVRQHDVEDHEVGMLRGRLVQGVGTGGSGEHLEPGEPQRGREQLTDVGLVLDDQQGGFGVRCSRHVPQCVRGRWEFPE